MKEEINDQCQEQKKWHHDRPSGNVEDNKGTL